VLGVRAALSGWPELRPVAGVRVAATALALGIETGGAQARAIDGVAATLRQQQAAAAEGHALGAQARLSALVIALAPLGFGVLAAGLDPATAGFLLRSRAGILCLGAGLGLDGLGGWWMARIAGVVPGAVP
jgi:tight adherence protein B